MWYRWSMAQALVVVDVMTGIFELPVPLHEPDRFVERVATLLAKARLVGALIVHVRHVGAANTRFATGAVTREFHPAALPARERARCRQAASRCISRHDDRGRDA